MAQFNVDAHLSNGKRLDWIALPEGNETPDDVLIKVRQAAMKKFGDLIWFNRWDHGVASNGYITVRMHAGGTSSSSRCGAAASSPVSST